MPKGISKLTNRPIKGMTGKKHSEKTKKKMRAAHKGQVPWIKGKKRTLKDKIQISKTAKKMGVGKWMSNRLGKNSNSWKGNEAGYRAKHCWVQKYYGIPATCEHCQTGNLVGHEIHWANISGLYLRKRTDWLRLCAMCHRLFDKN